MGFKLMLTGLILTTFFLLPALLDQFDPPLWVKAPIVLLAISGPVLVIIGALLVIWG